MIRIDLTSDAPVQIKCKTSDTFVFDGLDFYSDTAKTVPINISADTFRMQVLDSEGNIIVEDFTFTVSGTDDNHLKITASNVIMTLDPTPTGQPYSHFIEWTSTSTGKVITIATGQFIIEAKDKNA